MPKVTILVGDCRETLGRLPAASAACCVTSPPYLGRRRYMPDGHPEAVLEIGREATPDEYVATLVSVFREARRVMSPRASLWLNLGDAYAQRAGEFMGCAIKPKDLLMLPTRAAAALQSDGWWLRSHVIWSKPSAMPERVSDRPVCAHESVFLLAASGDYHYDAGAVREAATMKPQRRSGKREYGDGGVPKHRRGTSYVRREEVGVDSPDGKRHLRNVWTLPAQPYRGAHFASFPEALVEPCLKAGCHAGGLVLDPFGGTGTVGVVAHRLGLDAMLCELNPAYAELARERLLRSGIPPGDILFVEPGGEIRLAA